MSAFTELLADFTVQTLSGVVAVFVGVILALIVERRRRERDLAEHASEQMQEFERATDSVLGSVVKNTAESKRILGLLARGKTPALIHSELETSVWYATQDQFIALCRSVDERVIFAQFFDNVRRLQLFADYRCTLQASCTTAKVDRDDPDMRVLFTDIDQHFADLAEDVRFCGMLLVTDHGKPVHKRLMGIRVEPATRPATMQTSRTTS